MKKTLALVLALMMVLALVPSISVADDVENPYEEYGVEIYRDADGNVIDLGGMEIIVCDWWSSDWHDDEPTTASGEATYDYRTWLEETYNFTIKQVAATTWGASPDDFQAFAQAGGEENYVWILRANAVLKPMQAKLFYDLSTLDCLDFANNPKWNGAVAALTTVGDSVYGMRPEVAEPRKGIFFNKRLLTEAGVNPDSLYDMQANGTWDWAAFADLCETLTMDTDNDGVTDKYAMMSFSSHLIPAALVSNNAGFVGVENGEYVNIAESPEFLEAANWVMDMVKKYEMPAPEGASWDYFEPAFINGEVALTCHEEYIAGTLSSQMADEYGFVMFPKGPNATDYMFAPSDNVYVIPACYDAERAAKIAFAFNLFTEPTPGYGDTDDWMTGFKGIFCDARAVEETLALMRDTKHQYTWYTDMVAGYDLGPDFLWDVYGQGMTPAEKLESMRNTWQAYLDAANGK